MTTTDTPPPAEALADLLERAPRGERVLIERDGKAVAALIGLPHYTLLEGVIEALEDARDMKDYLTTKAEDDGDDVTLEELDSMIEAAEREESAAEK